MCFRSGVEKIQAITMPPMRISIPSGVRPLSRRERERRHDGDVDDPRRQASGAVEWIGCDGPRVDREADEDEAGEGRRRAAQHDEEVVPRARVGL